MSNNNEANDNNNDEVDRRDGLQQQQQHHNHNNIPQPQQIRGHPHDHDPLNNQNNPPEWAAFPDLLRVQEPQQNGGGVPVVGDGVIGGAGHLGGPVVLQRASVANPPDVSLPGAAGRDPPPPDFDIDRMGALHNQRLPDMALDADQAHGQAAAAAQHSLPDMALDASAAGGHGRTSGGHCGGTRVRPRRFPPPQPIHMGPQGFPIAAVPNQQNLPGSLARMAQAAAIGGGIRPVDNNGAFIGPGGENLAGRLIDLEAQVAGLRHQITERERQRTEESGRLLEELSALRRTVEASGMAAREHLDHASLENRLINMESLIQRLAQNPPVAVASHQQAVPEEVAAALRAEERRRQRRETERLARILAESLHVAVENFIARLNQEPGNDDRHHDDHPR